MGTPGHGTAVSNVLNDLLQREKAFLGSSHVNPHGNDLPLPSYLFQRDEKVALDSPHGNHHGGCGTPSSNGTLMFHAPGQVTAPHMVPSIPPVALPMLGKAGSRGQSPQFNDHPNSPDLRGTHLEERQRFSEIQELHDILSMKDQIIRGLGKQLDDLHAIEGSDSHGSLLARAERLRIGHEGLRADVVQMKQQRDGLLSEAAELRAELVRARAEAEGRAVAEDERLCSAKAELEAAQQELSQQRLDLSRAREALAGVEQQQQRCRSLAEEREVTLRRAEASIASLETKISASESEADAAGARAHSLEHGGDDVRRSLGRAQQLLEQRTEELQRARAALQKSASELRRKDAELTSLYGHLQQSGEVRPRRSLEQEMSSELTPIPKFVVPDTKDRGSVSMISSSGEVSFGAWNDSPPRQRIDAANKDLSMPAKEAARSSVGEIQSQQIRIPPAGYRHAGLEDPVETLSASTRSAPTAGRGQLPMISKASPLKASASTEVAVVVQALRGAIWEAGTQRKPKAAASSSTAAPSGSGTGDGSSPVAASGSGTGVHSNPAASTAISAPATSPPAVSAPAAASSWAPQMQVALPNSRPTPPASSPTRQESNAVDLRLQDFVSKQRRSGVPFKRLDDMGSYLYGSRVVRLSVSSTGHLWAAADGGLVLLEEFVKAHEEEEQNHLQHLMTSPHKAVLRPEAGLSQPGSIQLRPHPGIHPSRGPGSDTLWSSQQSPLPRSPHQVSRMRSAPQLSSFQTNPKGSVSLPPSLPGSNYPSWVPQPVQGPSAAMGVPASPPQEDLLAIRNSGWRAGQELARQWSVPPQGRSQAPSIGPPSPPVAPLGSTSQPPGGIPALGLQFGGPPISGPPWSPSLGGPPRGGPQLVGPQFGGPPPWILRPPGR